MLLIAGFRNTTVNSLQYFLISILEAVQVRASFSQHRPRQTWAEGRVFLINAAALPCSLPDKADSVPLIDWLDHQGEDWSFQ